MFHYANDCPDKSEKVKLTEDILNEENVESANIRLLTQREILIAEFCGTAILDTTCTKTVCETSWLQNFLENGGKVLSTQISHRPAPFKFGHGTVIHSDKAITIAGKIGKTDCKINVEVIPIQLPLLLSKESLKRAGAELDLLNDEAVLFGEKLKLELTSSGHYCVSITGHQNRDEIEDVMHSTAKFHGMSGVEKRKSLLKLHHQFAHANAAKLAQLLKSANIKDKQSLILLQEVMDGCDTCQKFKKPSPRPQLVYPRVVTLMTLLLLIFINWEVIYGIYIDDSIVYNKNPETFIEIIIKHWISVYGAPKRLVSDNGGEFNHESVIDMC